MSEPKFAFQCKNCGALEPAEAAGENAVPLACHVCRAGVGWKIVEGQPVREFHPENWIVLADLTPEQLAADFGRHGITHDRVVRHEAKQAGPPPGGRILERVTQEDVGSLDQAGGLN